MRVVIDTNVFVSGSIEKLGKSYQILKQWRNRKLLLIISEEIVKEICDVLKRPRIFAKYYLTNGDILELLELFYHSEQTLIVHPKEKLDIIKDDPKDNKFIECAIAGKATYIVSGDKHLLNLKRYKGIKIVNPTQFIKETQEPLFRIWWNRLFLTLRRAK